MASKVEAPPASGRPASGNEATTSVEAAVPPRWRDDARHVLVPWLVARVVVVGSLAVSRYLFTNIGHGRRPVALGQGLFAWDAAFYRSIAEHGYRSFDGSLRFFPLVPVVTRIVGWVTGDAVALVLVANASAFVLAVLLARLVRRDLHDEVAVDRAVWLVAIAPSAAVLVLGYAEATFMALAVATFLGLRSRRWWVAALCGYLAGLTRPLGALLTIGAAVEAGRGWRGASTRERIERSIAVVAPAAGTGTFLAWVGARYGDWLEPLHLQQRGIARGGFLDPARALRHSAQELLGRHHVGTGLHFVWALGFLALLVVVARRLPASYTAFAGTGLLLVLSSHNLDSLERYALSLFPLVVAGAVLIRSESVARPVLLLSVAGLVGYSVLAFFGVYVP